MDALYDVAPSAGRDPRTLASLSRATRNSQRWLYVVALAFTIGLAPLMALLQVNVGFGVALGVLLVATLIALMTRWPILGVYALAICAVVVEQEPLNYPIFTDHLYIFSWPVRLQGLPERPIGFLALLIVMLIIVRRLALRQGAALRLGPLIIPFLCLLACVAVGVAHGLTSGGDTHVIVLEVRPFWYLFLNYLIAYNLVTERRHVIIFLWITVLGTAIKAIQGVYIVLVPLGGHISGQNEIMAHEQSFFFVLVLLLILMCLLLNRFRALMWVALLSTPFLIVALLANNRRADYSAFIIGALCAWVFVVVVRPQYRATLIKGMVVVAILFAGYVLAFQHSTGTFAQPANAIVSVIHPSAADQRDLASNLYRYLEDYDLKYTESQSPILGYGFGRPFLQPLVLPNIITLDPYYLYVPHNTILWLWMRLGPAGYIAFFYLIGMFVMRSGIIARKLQNRDLQFMAIFGISVMMIELPLAYGDYQLFFYRNVFYLGLLMGIIMRLPHIEAAEATAQDTARQGQPAPTRDSAPRDERSTARAASRELSPVSQPALPSVAPGAYLRSRLQQRR